MLEQIDEKARERVQNGAPVLIAGPTASGKSALALEIAERFGGVVVNADALQVFADWRVLTARPSPEEEARAPHALYGHVPGNKDYSVGHWLRDLTPLLDGKTRPIITGGTGLYFAALTEGLAEIPATPPAIRAEADRRMADEGREALLAELDPKTRAALDPLNPMRVQRAWEVARATGRSMAQWRAETPPPRLPLTQTVPFVLMPDRDALRTRIATRFHAMLAGGALDEARENFDGWSPALPSAKAIGARELMAHLRGEMTLEAAAQAAIIASQQYAKRQRTWFRARMGGWNHIVPPL
ncbi:MAG: tRNA (adenosine(37)-N6)-dimethylallyltransferase MiaA [Rhodobacterales bacterium]|nr:MAG: tRNA (adenosine(37)-N6)-dimethylallyltransferase MiaA [Rhodobacterales bacterium]